MPGRISSAAPNASGFSRWKAPHCPQRNGTSTLTNSPYSNSTPHGCNVSKCPKERIDASSKVTATTMPGDSSYLSDIQNLDDLKADKTKKRNLNPPLSTTVCLFLLSSISMSHSKFAIVLFFLRECVILLKGVWYGHSELRRRPRDMVRPVDVAKHGCRSRDPTQVR